MVFGFFEKHPILFTSWLCLLLFLTASIFYNATPVYDFQVSYLILTGILAFCAGNFNKRIGIILLSLIIFLLLMITEANSLYYLWGEYIVLYLFISLNNLHRNVFIFSIIAAAFFLHLYYIQNTPANIRQHDLDGIILYMKQITLNHINIFKFDPWYMYYLFHQPLHFIIAGHLFFFTINIWSSNALALEGLQYLSLLYVTFATILVTKILNELNFSGKTLYAALILFAFNPTLTLFSGYLSDDVPTIFWSIFTIYFIIRWHKEELSKYIIYAAIGFGCGVLTKLSILMLVPALCFIFAYKLFISRLPKQQIIQQLCYFVIIAVPLSLLWIIRNHILFDMQFYNIPDTSPAGQSFKYLTLQNRFFDFTLFFTPFINAPVINDANIFSALIKTELFGEWDFSLTKPIVYFPALFLYLMNIFLKLFAIIGCVIVFLNSTFRRPIICMFAILYLTIWIYAVKYALDYPYVCSTDFRLFSQLMLPEIILQSIFFTKTMKNTAYIAISIFYAVLSCFIYMFAV